MSEGGCVAAAEVLARLEKLCRANGLALSGRFPVPAAQSHLPYNPSSSIALIGPAAKGGMWEAYSASPEAGDGAPDPLDRWSRRIIEGIAAQIDGTALFPFGKPHQPFLRWAQMSEPVWPSPLGMFVHAQRGLWLSYRGAIGFAAPISDPTERSTAQKPCIGCSQPCLSACPVDAFSSGEGDNATYDLAACTRHLFSPEGAPCRENGCLARLACPVGKEDAPPKAQRAFHLAAFLKARQCAAET